MVENIEDRVLRLISQRNNLLDFGGPLFPDPRMSSNWTATIWTEIPFHFTGDDSED